MLKNRILRRGALSMAGILAAALPTACGSPGNRAGAPSPALVKSDEMLETGTVAPQFSLKDSRGAPVNLADFRGKKNVVLVFYPGDNTPGCTKQLCAIRDDIADFRDAQTVVFGVNPQDAESHEAFAKKQGFPFPLLVDSDRKVTEAYGARGALMTKRTVYGIDKSGKIVFAQRGMPSNAEILAAFQ